MAVGNSQHVGVQGETMSDSEVEANLIFKPYLYNKIRILGKVDIKKLFELRYKTRNGLEA